MITGPCGLRGLAVDFEIDEILASCRRIRSAFRPRAARIVDQAPAAMIDHVSNS